MRRLSGLSVNARIFREQEDRGFAEIWPQYSHPLHSQDGERLVWSQCPLHLCRLFQIKRACILA